jgi:hypothetical protein
MAHAGEFDTARMLWFTTYQSTKEAQIRQNAVDHLLALQVDEDVTRLEHVVENTASKLDDYRPAWAIWARGLSHGAPADRRAAAADARWADRSAGPKSIYFITKGLPRRDATTTAEADRDGSK